MHNCLWVSPQVRNKNKQTSTNWTLFLPDNWLGNLVLYTELQMTTILLFLLIQVNMTNEIIVNNYSLSLDASSWRAASWSWHILFSCLFFSWSLRNSLKKRKNISTQYRCICLKPSKYRCMCLMARKLLLTQADLTEKSKWIDDSYQLMIWISIKISKSNSNSNNSRLNS